MSPLFDNYQHRCERFCATSTIACALKRRSCIGSNVLCMLTTVRNVAISTHNQALNAEVFLCREVQTIAQRKPERSCRPVQARLCRVKTQQRFAKFCQTNYSWAMSTMNISLPDSLNRLGTRCAR